MTSRLRPAEVAYSPQFYTETRDGAHRSAHALLPRVLEIWPTTSIVDVGCGTGAWLAVARQLGIERLCGIDGPHVDLARLEVGRDEFLVADLEQRLDVSERYDLVLSLEVAEHLSAEAAPIFVDTLTKLGPAILFSAAVPCQGGVRHVNEQWPDYWAALLRERGYRPVGNLRTEFWNDDRVEWWYRQNIFLFVHHGLLGRVRTLDVSEPPPACLPLVHPGNYYWQQQRRCLLGRILLRLRRLLGGNGRSETG